MGKSSITVHIAERTPFETGGLSEVACLDMHQKSASLVVLLLVELDLPICRFYSCLCLPMQQAAAKL